MVEASQGWTLDQALAMVPRLEPFRLDWLEEPLRADRPWAEWRAPRGGAATPPAARASLRGDAALDPAPGARGAVGVAAPHARGGWGVPRPPPCRGAPGPRRGGREGP